MTETKLSLDQAYQRLKQIHQQVESGQVNLEDSIPLFKEAGDLGKFLKKRLSKIETEIEEIALEFKDLSQDSSPDQSK